MPEITLTDHEARDAALAARIASRQAEQDAIRQSNPRIKKMFEESAQRYLTLADKFERVRLSPSSKSQ